MTDHPTTLDSLETAAEACRARGWQAGTLLTGTDREGTTVIEITAVGTDRILAKVISHDGQPEHRSGEGIWALDGRDWQPVVSRPHHVNEPAAALVEVTKMGGRKPLFGK